MLVISLIVAMTPCESVPGADALLRAGNVILLGEIHGTQESPEAVSKLVCLALEKGLDVTVALEIPVAEQSRVERFLAGGAPSDLLAGAFWSREYQDGRSSAAMSALVTTLRRYRIESERERDLDVILIDDPDAEGGRDRFMAERLAERIAAAPKRFVIALTGNLHNRLSVGTPFNAELEPMGFLLSRRLRQTTIVSLHITHGGGSAWICTGSEAGDCGVRELTGREGGLGIELRDEEGPFSGRYHVERVTASPPAREPYPVRRLTTSGARNGQPFWSPDGRRISFVSNRSGAWQVWLMSSGGTDARALTHMDEPVGWPSWSPGGETIWFYAGSGPYRLVTVDASGGEPAPIAGPFSDLRPSVSPDGTKLLFDRYGASDPANHEIYVRDLKTGVETRLTHDPGYDSDARWSPRGTEIVFHSDRDGREPYDTQIYVMNADGAGLRRLTFRGDKNVYPAWSPHGRRVVYVSDSEGQRDLWCVALDGSGEERLTTHAGMDSEPAWSPDGTSIVFATDRFGDSMELAILERASTACRPSR